MPASGEVNFTLTEFWAVLKGPASQNLVLGDATVTVGYPDGRQTQIAFQQSGLDVEVDLQNAGYIEANGTTTWTQVAYLNPGTAFRTVSTTMAQADDPFKPFEGGQAGAYVFGFSRGISTDAPLSTAGNSGPTLTTNPPPPHCVAQCNADGWHHRFGKSRFSAINCINLAPRPYNRSGPCLTNWC